MKQNREFDLNNKSDRDFFDSINNLKIKEKEKNFQELIDSYERMLFLNFIQEKYKKSEYDIEREAFLSILQEREKFESRKGNPEARDLFLKSEIESNGKVSYKEPYKLDSIMRIHMLTPSSFEKLKELYRDDYDEFRYDIDKKFPEDKNSGIIAHLGEVFNDADSRKKLLKSAIFATKAISFCANPALFCSVQCAKLIVESKPMKKLGNTIKERASSYLEDSSTMKMLNEKPKLKKFLTMSGAAIGIAGGVALYMSGGDIESLIDSSNPFDNTESMKNPETSNNVESSGDTAKADQNTPTDGNTNADPNAPTDGNTNADPNTPTNGNANADPNAPTDGNTNADPNTPTDGNTKADPNTPTDGNTKADPNAPTNGNPNADPNDPNSIFYKNFEEELENFLTSKENNIEYSSDFDKFALNNENSILYKTEYGDSLSKILERIDGESFDLKGSSLEEACKALAHENGISDPNKIGSNVNIKIPKDIEALKAMIENYQSENISTGIENTQEFSGNTSEMSKDSPEIFEDNKIKSDVLINSSSDLSESTLAQLDTKELESFLEKTNISDNKIASIIEKMIEKQIEEGTFPRSIEITGTNPYNRYKDILTINKDLLENSLGDLKQTIKDVVASNPDRAAAYYESEDAIKNLSQGIKSANGIKGKPSF